MFYQISRQLMLPLNFDTYDCHAYDLKTFAFTSHPKISEFVTTEVERLNSTHESG